MKASYQCAKCKLALTNEDFVKETEDYAYPTAKFQLLEGQLPLFVLCTPCMDEVVNFIDPKTQKIGR
jgi:hypothetical protein